MTLQDKMFEAIKENNTHVNPDSDIEESAKSCAEIANQEKIAFAIEVLDWFEKLTPNQKVSYWSKDGQYRGLFNMDSEQLVKKFEELKIKSQQK